LALTAITFTHVEEIEKRGARAKTSFIGNWILVV